MSTLLALGLWSALPPVGAALALDDARVTAAVTTWGPDCGPRPQSTALPRQGQYSVGAGGRVSAQGGAPVFEPGICRATTQQPEITERSASPTRFACAMPDGAARDIQGAVELRALEPSAEGAARFEVVSDLRYRWSLKGSVCDARLIERRVFSGPASSPAAPVSAPPSSTCAQLGPPARLQSAVGLRLAAAPGSRLRLAAHAVDAQGCRTPGQVRFQSSAGAVDPANVLDLRDVPPGTRVAVTATLDAPGASLPPLTLVVDVANDDADLRRLLAELPPLTSGDGAALAPQTGEALVTLDAPEKADSGTAVLGARLLLVSFLGALALSGVLGVAIVWRTVRARRVGPVLADEDARVLERSLALKRKAAAPLVCPQCGERYPEETVFCGLDGARLERVN